ncbi:peptidase M61 [Polymorphobacter sp. PAMC 29334]|uniref:M61 family metallopeptidase n=1 Tax=Polymorphobacter sp. PAMC 29334 TaxID=2862331 RepID=UPI001C78BAC0|nr:peptidase M61 [Polymorphobacter sp. PAMC 29334]QYE36605.1 peptidase M61 [Polymorphobacter sp. PAMC 29334]
MTYRATLAAVIALATAPAAWAANSAPQPAPIVDTIPDSRDIAFPGTIKLDVDASDTARGIFRVHETIPVTAGPLVLLYPEWLPGDHAPEGTIDKLAGLTITAGGKSIPWVRDHVDVSAFHLVVPPGVASIDISFQFLSATAEAQGRVVMTPDLLNLEWNSVILYPAGYFARRIMVDAGATYPAGWTSATALRTTAVATGAIQYPTVDLDTLVDSPVYAGRYARIEQLSPDVTLNLFADRPSQLVATPEEIAAHRNLVVQANKLYGAQHYDHYNFLLAISDRLGGVGLEHHRSSEDGVAGDYFMKWSDTVGEHDLLPHEYTHSWNGKFRRPADLWTPEFRTPMRNSLLWVYEGQTQFWGNILAERSGLVDHDDAMGALAEVAARYSTLPGRKWRPLVDTTNEEIVSQRRPVGWASWQRTEDYYSEGQLIWLEVDAIIREQSHGRKSMDDFAKAFFGIRDRDWGELTYTFDDVSKTLNGVVPYDWAGFLHARVDAVAPVAPLGGIERGGYRLAFTDTPTHYWKAGEGEKKIVDLTYSLGMVVDKDAVLGKVEWDGPAFKAGLTVGTTIVAVDGDAYSDDRLKEAVTSAKGTTTPIRLLVKSNDAFRDVVVDWTGGLRYPRLERTGKGPSTLDALYAAH